MSFDACTEDQPGSLTLNAIASVQYVCAPTLRVVHIPAHLSRQRRGIENSLPGFLKELA